MKLSLQIIILIQTFLIAFLYLQNNDLLHNNSQLIQKLNESKNQLIKDKVVENLGEQKHKTRIYKQETRPSKQQEHSLFNLEALDEIDEIESYMFNIEERIDDIAYLIRTELNIAQTEQDILTSLNSLTQLDRINLSETEVTNLLAVSLQHSKELHLEVLDFLEGSLAPQHANALYPYLESEDLKVSALAFIRLKELDKTEFVIGMLDELAFNARHQIVKKQAFSYLQYVNQTTKPQS